MKIGCPYCGYSKTKEFTNYYFCPKCQRKFYENTWMHLDADSNLRYPVINDSSVYTPRFKQHYRFGEPLELNFD
jgi:sarcosine oxidase delta subunit